MHKLLKHFEELAHFKRKRKINYKCLVPSGGTRLSASLCAVECATYETNESRKNVQFRTEEVVVIKFGFNSTEAIVLFQMN